MNFLKSAASRAYAYVDSLYDREPARVNAAVVAVLVALGGAAVSASALALVPVVLAILLGGDVTRSQVASPKTQRALVRHVQADNPDA